MDPKIHPDEDAGFPLVTYKSYRDESRVRGPPETDETYQWSAHTHQPPSGKELPMDKKFTVFGEKISHEKQNKI